MASWWVLIFKFTPFYLGAIIWKHSLTILLDGLQFSSYLFIVSAGLTIIFGVMKILNVAHGSFYAWGAYTQPFSLVNSQTWVCLMHWVF